MLTTEQAARVKKDTPKPDGLTTGDTELQHPFVAKYCKGLPEQQSAKSYIPNLYFTYLLQFHGAGGTNTLPGFCMRRRSLQKPTLLYAHVIVECSSIHAMDGQQRHQMQPSILMATQILTSGILENKCPYAHRYDDIRDACDAKSFFCTMSKNGTISLKTEHTHYHQVQLQLFVTQINWCEFCVYTTKGIAVQRIYPDKMQEANNIPKLEYFYDNLE